jgi:hypothetical protein
MIFFYVFFDEFMILRLELVDRHDLFTLGELSLPPIHTLDGIVVYTGDKVLIQESDRKSDCFRLGWVSHIEEKEVHDFSP